MLPEDKSLLSHPILFQTPVMNKQLDANPDLIRTTDPSKVWDPSDYGMNKAELYNPADPPLTPNQRASLITKLRPIARKTMENQEGTMLFYTFMSQENLKEIHQRIRKTVFDISGFRIADQNESEMLIAMQNVYMSYANNLNENLISKGYLFKHIRAEVNRLDNILVRLVVPTIINSAEQRKSATSIFDNPVKQADLPLPVSTSIAGTREYRDTVSVLTGPLVQPSMVVANTSSLHFT